MHTFSFAHGFSFCCSDLLSHTSIQSLYFCVSFLTSAAGPWCHTHALTWSLQIKIITPIHSNTLYLSKVQADLNTKSWGNLGLWVSALRSPCVPLHLHSKLLSIFMSQPFAVAEAFSLCDFQVVLQTVKEIKAWSSRVFSQTEFFVNLQLLVNTKEKCSQGVVIQTLLAIM